MGLISMVTPAPTAPVTPLSTQPTVPGSNVAQPHQVQTAAGTPQAPATATQPGATPSSLPTVAPAPTFEARTVTDNETVAGQMNKLLSKESPYIQSARNRGMETANARGLINSTLAAGTSERAAIDASLPIAQQDATTYAQSGLSAQDATQNAGLSHQTFQHTVATNQQNINANVQLQTQSEAAQMARQQEAESSALAQQTQQQKATADLQLQQQKATADLQTALKQMDITLDTAKLDAESRNALTAAVAPIIQQVQANISQIQATPDQQMLPALKDVYIKQQQDYLKANIQTISTLYGYQLDWPAVAPEAPGQTGTEPANTPARSGTGPANRPADPGTDTAQPHPEH